MKKILNSDLPNDIYYFSMRQCANDLGAAFSSHPIGEMIPFYEDYDHNKLAGYINSTEYEARCP